MRMASSNNITLTLNLPSPRALSTFAFGSTAFLLASYLLSRHVLRLPASSPSPAKDASKKRFFVPRSPTFFSTSVGMAQGDPPEAEPAKKRQEEEEREKAKAASLPGSLGEAELVRLMLPDDANPAGNVHGGTILKLIEQVGWVVAARHVNSGTVKDLLAVTARIEKMDFHEPVYIGEIVTLKAKLGFASSRSMMVVVKVFAENPLTQARRHTNTAILWYVGLYSEGKEEPLVWNVPPFTPQTAEEKELYSKGEAMYLRRKKAEQEARELLPDHQGKEEKDLDPSHYPADPDALPVSHSQTELVQLMLPSDCTSKGIVQGGVIMKLMDNAAGCVAVRHCKTNVVTVSLEAMDFKAPVSNGGLVFVKARLNYVSQRSLEIEVLVEAENLLTGKKVVTNTSLFKFVSLDKNHRPQNVRGLKLETREEVASFLEGKRRYDEAKKGRSK